MQILIFIVIVIIGIYAFKGKNTITTRQLAIASSLIVLYEILNLISFSIPILGFDAFKIGFGTIPLMIIGIVVNKKVAYLSALVADGIGLIVTSTAYPFLGFTLNTVLIIMISNFIFHNLKGLFSKNMVKQIIKYGFYFTIFIFYLYLFMINEITIDKQVIEVTNSMRIVIILISLAIIVIFHIIKLHIKQESAADVFIACLISTFIIYLFVYTTLNPIWLNYMYGIPIFVSLFIRLIKCIFMIPINTFILYTIVKHLKLKTYF